MNNEIIFSPSVLSGQDNMAKTVFLTDKPEVLDPFSLSDITNIFKKDGDSGSSSGGSGSGSGGSGVGASIATGILGLLTAAAPILPTLGIGSKSRIKENNAIANANAQLYNAQTQASLAKTEAEKQNTKEMLYIGGGIALVLIILLVLIR
jgi:hypothetical protein